MKQYFILGTDTDCGKTYVTCQLLTYFQNQNKSVKAIKPVASGCRIQNGVLVSDDELRLNAQQNTEDIGLWRFEAPVAPHLVAREQGVTMTIESMITFCNKQNAEHVLIEGAGGLMVPLNAKETWLDFLVRSRIPVILVVGMKLGCLNHALLTMSVLNTYQVHCIGWIANCLDEQMLYLEENIATLVEKMGCPLLGRVPYQNVFIPDVNREFWS